jgi:hypothetical protein
MLVVYEYNFSEGVYLRDHRAWKHTENTPLHKLVHCKKSNHICYAENQIYYVERIVLQCSKAGISGISFWMYDIEQNASIVAYGNCNTGHIPITKIGIYCIGALWP